MQDEFNLEETVKVYIKLRDAVDELREKQKQEMEELEAKKEIVSNALLEFCNSQNLDSVKTKEGTLSRRVSTRFWTTDWEAMSRVIIEHNAVQLLERRIHQGNMKQFLEEYPEAFPAGLQSDNKYTIQVRRPTDK